LRQLLLPLCFILAWIENSALRCETTQSESPVLAALQAAAEKGDAHAQRQLADAYAGSIDSTNAFGWYRKAAEQGDPLSQWQLARYYEFGSGPCSVDREKARNWYLKAARQGCSNAQLDLGQLYETGRAGAPDYIEAHKWYTIAQRNDSLLARANRDRLAVKMTPEQIQEADRRADEFNRPTSTSSTPDGSVESLLARMEQAHSLPPGLSKEANPLPEIKAAAPVESKSVESLLARMAQAVPSGPSGARTSAPETKPPPPVDSAPLESLLTRMAQAVSPHSPSPSPVLVDETPFVVAKAVTPATLSPISTVTNTQVVSELQTSLPAPEGSAWSEPLPGHLSEPACVTASASDTTAPAAQLPQPTVIPAPELAMSKQIPEPVTQPSRSFAPCGKTLHSGFGLISDFRLSQAVVNVRSDDPAPLSPIRLAAIDATPTPKPTPPVHPSPPEPQPTAPAKPLKAPEMPIPTKPPTVAVEERKGNESPAVPPVQAALTLPKTPPAVVPAVQQTNLAVAKAQPTLMERMKALRSLVPMSTVAPGPTQTNHLAAPKTNAKPAVPANLLPLDKLRLSAVAALGKRRAASINGRSVFQGEETEFEFDGIRVKVRCLEVKRSSALLQVAGMAGTIELKMPQVGK
jgi:hypothetical protein